MPVGREKAIFLSALDFEAVPDREAFLAAACGADQTLRRSVDELLNAHDRSFNVLDEHPELHPRFSPHLDDLAAAMGFNTDSTEALPVHIEYVGEVIANYRVMEKIGEGGFGQVYVAEQHQPVRRRVALKLLKPGMVSREVIARFEAERQALAMMEHANIARIFDAGATTGGQPYFVMELVRGVPITTFCEQRRLTIRQRLELFIDVCQAVQHAHQKGVIHRDLKPSNVMVTLHDATPIVKVIDFGVAKAISEPLTDKTIYTRFAQMIGTPMYMSPEQAELNGLDVDTRSDVFSLGVLLYELLTGVTPFDQRRIHSASFDELRRIIREEEPPRPSTRISTLSRSRITSAANPSVEPRSLANLLRGELDWVVMKALEKDRRRRYDAAADLARDVQRYLDQQPVLARPPSQWYRMRKFAQRNRVTFTTALLVLLALLAGTAASTWQAIRATRALAEAETSRKEAVEFANRLKEANVLLDSARGNVDEQRWNLAWKQYTKATELQPEHYLTWSGRGSLSVRLGAWRAAAADYAKALKLGAPANNPGWWGVPQLCVYAGNDEAYRLVRISLRKQLDEVEDSALTMFAIRSLSVCPLPRDEARALAQRAEKLFERQRAPAQVQGAFPPPQFLMDHRHGRLADGEGFPDGFPPSPGFPKELEWYVAGLACYRAGDASRAVELLNQVVDSESKFPPTRIAYPALAMAYHALGRKSEAEAALASASEAIAEWAAAGSADTLPRVPMPWFDFLECIVLHREAHTLLRGFPPPEDAGLALRERRALTLLQDD